MKDRKDRVSCRQCTYRFVVAALIALLAILPIQACRPREKPTSAPVGPSDDISGAPPPSVPAPPREDAVLLSQVQTIRFERISGQDGLSQNTILSILQDRRGFMWFGTEGGLNKYDGYHFTVYKHGDDPTTLSDDYVSAIHEDPDGSLWVGTRSGLDRLDRATGTFEHYRHDPDDPTSLGGTWVVVIYEDNQGTLWIGTEDGGLDRLDRDTGTFVHHRHDTRGICRHARNLLNSFVPRIWNWQDGVDLRGPNRSNQGLRGTHRPP